MEVVICDDPPQAAMTLETLYEERYDAMVRLAYLLLGAGEPAHDIVQDAFVGVARRLATVRDPSAYLSRAVVNGCRSHQRRSARDRGRTTRTEQVDVGYESEVDEMWDQLQALPERQRAALSLRYYGDLSEREIATVLGCRPGTVGSLIHRGLGTLRGVVDR